jgi:hypothetical protein
MIEVYIYGHLKKKFDKNAKLADNTKITMPFISDENFFGFLKRLNLDIEEIGESFLNHNVVSDKENAIIPDGARVAIFSQGMFLLCGGQHLKGHGFIKRTPSKDLEYYE